MMRSFWNGLLVGGLIGMILGLVFGPQMKAGTQERLRESGEAIRRGAEKLWQRGARRMREVKTDTEKVGD